MDAASVREMLARHAAGALTDDDLLAHMRAWHAAAPDGLEDLRRAWPSERLPVIGEYFCVADLGEGASGMVYRAVRWGPAPHVVALKLLRLIADEDKRRFFEREVEILKGLHCRHVARYLDSGTVHGTSFLCMELVEGTPLDDYLTIHAPGLDAKLGILAKVARAVAELHEAGVVHRDLKPRHIIVDAHGQPHIVDLGLSAARGDDWATLIRKTQTRLGRIIGTLKYMSPEQAWGGLYPTDHRADIWALGVILFEIVTNGSLPYSQEPLEGMSPADALLYRIQHETPARPQIADPRYASALTTLITRCLAHEPRHRLNSARALAEDIERIRERQHITTRPLPATYRAQRIAIGLALRARSALWSASILGTVIVIFTAVFLLNVHWVSQADAYSASTQRRLAEAAAARGTIDFRVAGICDSTLTEVPRWAASNGFPGVTSSVNTWRGVHGELMQRLADARPLMVVWDYFYPTAEPQDAAFIAGVRALDDAGVPVVIGLGEIHSNGLPDLTPSISGPLGDTLHTGLLLARNMVAFPGEYLIALRHGDTVYPSVITTAFGALCYPRCSVSVHWPRRDDGVQLRYRNRDRDSYQEALDDIEIHSKQEILVNRRLENRGELVAYAAIPLGDLPAWRARKVRYEALLHASPEELRQLVGGRILLIGEMLSATPFFTPDRHRVRFNSGTVADVPGVYLVGMGIDGLLSNRHKVFHLPLLGRSFSVIIGASLAACVMAVVLATRPAVRRLISRAVLPLVAGCLVLAGVFVWGMAQADSASAVLAAIAGAALFLTLPAALLIERARYARHVNPR
ncbi:MAG: protein kinase [Phycisphaerales bacterium]|nr:protein kinase [Phycisphaerales bacterium]